MMQQPPKTMEMLHPQDVGAASGRPRATNRRPYEVFRYVFEFCNRPILILKGRNYYAIMLLYNGNKVGYIAKKEHLAHVTYLRLGRKIYAVITNVIDDTYPTRYEFETWFDMEK